MKTADLILAKWQTVYDYALETDITRDNGDTVVEWFSAERDRKAINKIMAIECKQASIKTIGNDLMVYTFEYLDYRFRYSSNGCYVRMTRISNGA